MKILLTSGIYKPDIGGPATFIPKLASFLQKKGIEVEVVTLRNKNAKLQIEEWNVKYAVRQTNKVLRVIRTIMLIKQSAKKSDILFSNGLYIETAIANIFKNRFMVAKIVGDPVWEKIRNLNYQNHKSFSSLQKIQFEILRKIYNLAFKSFDIIICPSKELCEVVNSWNIGVKVEYIPNGVEIKQLAPIKEKKFDLVTVCRLVPWKNVDKLIRICSKNNLRLAVIGEGPQLENLKNLSIDLNSQVTFFGSLDVSEIETVLQESKVFCLYSDYEGLSFALLHALSLGMPVCVSDIPGNSQVVTTEEVGVKLSGNEKIDSNLIRNLVEDEKKQLFISVNGRKHVEMNFNIDEILKLYLKIITKSY